MKRTALVSTLELVGRALASTNMVPIFQCFCFKDKTVTGYNDAIGITAPCEVEETFAVHGSTLLGLLKNSHSDEVTFTLEGQEVIIKAGRSTFKLPFFPEENYLFNEPEGIWPLYMTLDQALLDGLAACLMTSSKDFAYPAWMGVCFNATQRISMLYSCDGDAVTAYKLLTAKGKHDTPFVVPNEFCEAVLKICEETEASEKSDLNIGGEWAMATLDTGYKIYGRIIQNNNPLDHAALISKTVKGESTFVALPKGLDHALSRARVVADPESKPTRLSVEAGRLKLLTEASSGIVKESLAIDDHPDVVANVSAEKVQRAISICDQMEIRENCTVFRAGDVLLQVVSNMH